MNPSCPECQSTDLNFLESRNRFSCNSCKFSFELTKSEHQKLRIFLSYGLDVSEELVCRIKANLEKRGHDMWFDKSEIKFDDDWLLEIPM